MKAQFNIESVATAKLQLSAGITGIKGIEPLNSPEFS